MSNNPDGSVCQACEDAAKLCEGKGKHWQSLTPNIISPVACAAADCADTIRSSCRHRRRVAEGQKIVRLLEHEADVAQSQQWASGGINGVPEALRRCARKVAAMLSAHPEQPNAAPREGK